MVKVSLGRAQWLGYKQSFGKENDECLLEKHLLTAEMRRQGSRVP